MEEQEDDEGEWRCMRRNEGGGRLERTESRAGWIEGWARWISMSEGREGLMERTRGVSIYKED